MSAPGDGRQSRPQAVREGSPGKVVSGPGALCAEAQADGVPCTELGRDCEVCRLAVNPPTKDAEDDGPA
jgi:hypothetical protein